VGIGGRCRVLAAERGEGRSEFRGSLEDWRLLFEPDYPGLRSDWVSYPGVFAHGRLDPGTRLLLDCLPPLPPRSRVLDYGCGSGMVGEVARLRCREPRLTLLDVDTVALEAARENVPEAALVLGDGLPRGEAGLHDFVLTNPPLHQGRAEVMAMIVELATGAVHVLSPEGALVVVAQRRVPLEESLRRHYEEVSLLGQDAVFRVWEGSRPRRSPG
jgi:16S rRNA (guanine1207-N2)-methyltransferase